MTSLKYDLEMIKFSKYNNLFNFEFINIIMNVTYKTISFLFVLNIICFAVAVGMDYYDKKIDKISIHLILLSVIFTIGFVLSITRHDNEKSIFIPNAD
jgi:hypothetical protein